MCQISRVIIRVLLSKKFCSNICLIGNCYIAISTLIQDMYTAFTENFTTNFLHTIQIKIILREITPQKKNPCSLKLQYTCPVTPQNKSSKPYPTTHTKKENYQVLPQKKKERSVFVVLPSYVNVIMLQHGRKSLLIR